MNSITITDNYIFIDNKRLEIEKNIRYDSEVKITNSGFRNLLDQLGILEEFIIKESHPKSMVVLLNKEREKNFHSGFDKNFLEGVNEGFDALLSGNILFGIKLIKGKGFGLTPSGDDFICGILYGLYLIQKGTGKDLSGIRNEIFRIAKSENQISNNFLRLSKEGRFFEYLKDFVTHPRPLSLEKRGEKEHSKSLEFHTYHQPFSLRKRGEKADSRSLESSKIPLFFKEGLGELKKIISTGETSGADLLTGFLTALKRFSN